MNLEKFTERSRGFIQAAQTIAIREENQRVVPEHLLKALMDDDQGLASNLITRSGGDAKRVQQAVDQAVAKLPKVSGGNSQVYVDPSMVRVLDEAEKVAKKAGDSFVPAERILMALAMVNTNAKDALEAGSVKAQNLNAAINDIRKGRTADSASAEDSYEALEKYARDLTQAARDGKIDPIIALWGPFLLASGLVLWMYHVIAHRPGGQPIAALEFAFAKIGKQIGRLIRLGRRRPSAEGAA